MPDAKLVHVTKVEGGGDLYLLRPFHATDPGFGVGGGGGRPDQGLPGHGGHPGNRPPGSGHPAFPDNSLPSGRPPVVAAGETLILVRDPEGIWHYASLDASTPPPKPLPTPPPDYATGQPVPPVPTPT
jgi:hypothetical protein